MLCSVAVPGFMLPTGSDLRRKDQAWKEVARHSPFFAWLACPAGAAGGAPTAAAPQLRNAATAGLDICTCLVVAVYMWTQNVRRLDDFESLLLRRLWPAGRAGEGKQRPAVEAALQFLSSPVGSRSGGCLAGRTCCCRWAGPTLDLLAVSRMSPSRMLCCRQPECLTFAEEKNRHGKKWP